MVEIGEKGNEIKLKESIPVLWDCDVAVIGGGISGAAAAMETAAAGRKTVLIEQNTFVGGLCDGTMREWEEEGLEEIWTDFRRGIREETAQELLERLLEKSVHLYLNTAAVEVIKEEGRIGVIVATKRGLRLIRSACVIDASGKEIFAETCGISGKKKEMYARTIFGIGGVGYEEAVRWMEEQKIPHGWTVLKDKSGQEKGEFWFSLPEFETKEWKGLLSQGRLFLSFYGSQKVSQVAGLERKVEDENRETETDLIIFMNEVSVKMAALLKKRIPGFERSYLDWTAPCIGLRGGFMADGIETDSSLIPVRRDLEENGRMTPLLAWSMGKEAGAKAVQFTEKDRFIKQNSTFEAGRVWQREAVIPAGEECDVLVVGGGAAGIVAAISAARKGMNTVLIERNPLLGGDMLAGGLSWLSYYNLYREFGCKEKQLVYGIPYEIVKRLIEIGGSPGFYEDIAPFTQECKGTHGDRECMKTLFLRMVREAGVRLLLRSLFLDALVEKGENDRNIVKGAIIQSQNGRYAIQAKIVIDASGDGDVAWYAGANCREYSSHSVGMAFGMTGLELEKALNYAREKNAVAHEAYGQTGEMEGKLVKYSLRTYFLPELLDGVEKSGLHTSFCVESAHDGEGSYINGVNTKDSNILDPERATETIIELRRNIFRSAAFLKENIPGFEKGEVNWCTQIPGARQTRCIDCHCSVSEMDVENCVIPKDTIGLFGGTDGHYAGYRIRGGGWYGIPYRALLPNFVGNLLVAGRMLSADWAAYMSTRLNVSCFIQGQAAGTAAAMAIREKCPVERINVSRLQEELRKDGVYLEGIPS